MRRLPAVMIGAVLTASCTDSPTSSPAPAGPVLDASPSGCVADGGTCTLDPIIVVGDPGGGDGGGGGGGGGGGSGDDGGGGDDQPPCELMEGGDPTVQSCPGGGGGEPYYPPDDDQTACDPAIHPDCEKPLTAADTATINRALRDMLRTTFTDSTAERQCAEMKTWFQEAMAAGAVFRGAFDSNSSNDPYGSHYGMYSGSGNIHFDPRWLDAANAGNTDALREVAITALHEAAHRRGYHHEDPAEPTFDAQGRDSYTSAPFNSLNPGPNSCVPR